jgi:polyisoprenoid-binding protein YceI
MTATEITEITEITEVTEVRIPGYLSGTWAIDPVHSYVGFVVRYAMMAYVRGQFETVHGEIVTDHEILDSRVDVTIDAASFHTNNETRNQDISSTRFLDVENFPTMAFTSTSIRLEDRFLIEGDLTIKGVTKPVVLQATTPRFGPNHEGKMTVGVSAHTVISKSDFGVGFNVPMAAGGFMLSDDIEVILEVHANLAGHAEADQHQ